jgi:hypothetical protein
MMMIHNNMMLLALVLVVLLLLAPESSTAFQVQQGRRIQLPPWYPSSSRLYSSSGPKAAGRQRTPRSGGNAASGPKGAATRERPQRRQTPGAAAALFDGQALTAAQSPKEDAPPLDLDTSVAEGLRCTTENMSWTDTPPVPQQPPFTFMSLDDLFGAELGFSATFNSDTNFRQALREAIRKDIFDTTPFYANLSEKAASVLLLPDSSLEGSWRRAAADYDPAKEMIRMKQTTGVLADTLGDKAMTGDELFAKIGGLCGSKPSTHWIDIFGVQDRKVNHSWHQDFGKSPENSRTVLWGFPNADQYQGCGVFPHIVALQKECLAPDGLPRMEPVLFQGTIDEDYIIRPEYCPGRELIMYRDIDVLHSSPDVIYRASVMRFM